jgi:hypothetical protein
LFTFGKLIIGLYLGKASFASTYGPAASVVVLIICSGARGAGSRTEVIDTLPEMPGVSEITVTIPHSVAEGDAIPLTVMASLPGTLSDSRLKSNTVTIAIELGQPNPRWHSPQTQ